MKKRIQHCCRSMVYYLAYSKAKIEFVAKFREYGIAAGTGDMIVIEFCPWCGTRFPKSLRMKWFDRIDELGIDEVKDAIPKEMKSDEWYSGEGKKPRRKPLISNLPKRPAGAVSRRVLKF